MVHLLLTVAAAAAASACCYYYFFLRRRSEQRHSLRDKLVLVTGGGSGIGAELCYRLAVREGAVVFALDVSDAGLRETRERIEAEHGRCSAFRCDVSNESEVNALVKLIESRGQPIDVLVNNAGVAVRKTFVDSTNEELERTFRVNVFAHFYTIRAVLHSMLNRHEGGHIVQIGSTMDCIATPSLAAYGASKWAVGGFTEALREELLDSPVRITLVRPWIVGTPMFATAAYWNHPWFSRVAPPTTVVDVADAIIDGIVYRRDVVTVPWHFSLAGILFQMLPSDLRARGVKWLGLNKLI